MWKAKCSDCGGAWKWPGCVCVVYQRGFLAGGGRNFLLGNHSSPIKRSLNYSPSWSFKLCILFSIYLPPWQELSWGLNPACFLITINEGRHLDRAVPKGFHSISMVVMPSSWILLYVLPDLLHVDLKDVGISQHAIRKHSDDKTSLFVII